MKILGGKEGNASGRGADVAKTIHGPLWKPVETRMIPTRPRISPTMTNLRRPGRKHSCRSSEIAETVVLFGGRIVSFDRIAEENIDVQTNMPWTFWF